MKQFKDTTNKEYALIRLITIRAIKDDPELDKQSLEMDLCAVHEKNVRMNFDKLLAADNFNFNHDVYGIIRHMNRKTAKLENCFLPRCSI